MACWGVRAQDLEAMTSYTGAELYKEYCASCHGDKGHGDGPVAFSMKVEVPDLTRIAARHGGTYPADQMRKIIDGSTTMPPHGTREMPVWGWAFRANARADDPKAQYRTQVLIGLLVDYLRSMQQK
jgi:mono/diheme cytochrome c family protein